MQHLHSQQYEVDGSQISRFSEDLDLYKVILHETSNLDPRHVQEQEPFGLLMKVVGNDSTCSLGPGKGADSFCL